MEMNTKKVLQMIYYLAVENKIKVLETNIQSIQNVHIEPILYLLNDITLNTVWVDKEHDYISCYKFCSMDKQLKVEIRLRGEEAFYDQFVLWDFETDYQYY